VSGQHLEDCDHVINGTLHYTVPVPLMMMDGDVM
jgi:hypothetical protein